MKAANPSCTVPLEVDNPMSVGFATVESATIAD